MKRNTYVSLYLFTMQLVCLAAYICTDKEMYYIIMFMFNIGSMISVLFDDKN